jgi:hypothetical protein
MSLGNEHFREKPPFFGRCSAVAFQKLSEQPTCEEPVRIVDG